VACPVGRKGGEGRMEARCRWVYLRQVADDSNRPDSLPLGDQEGDRGEGGFHRENPGGSS